MDDGAWSDVGFVRGGAGKGEKGEERKGRGHVVLDSRKKEMTAFGNLPCVHIKASGSGGKGWDGNLGGLKGAGEEQGQEEQSWQGINFDRPHRLKGNIKFIPQTVGGSFPESQVTAACDPPVKEPSTSFRSLLEEHMDASADEQSRIDMPTTDSRNHDLIDPIHPTQRRHLPHKKPQEPWFLRRCTAAQATSSSPQANSRRSHSIAELLDHDPIERHRPKRKIHTHIGPANPGYQLLASMGWTEGSSLGLSRPPPTHPQIIEHPPTESVPNTHQVTSDVVATVIDDTDQGSDDEADQDAFCPDPNSESSQPQIRPEALLVPLKSRYKNDRLGIGIKATTTARPSLPPKDVGSKKLTAKQIIKNQKREQREARALLAYFNS